MTVPEGDLNHCCRFPVMMILSNSSRRRPDARMMRTISRPSATGFFSTASKYFSLSTASSSKQSTCHDRDIPPQPSHACSCLLAVQTPPEHSLTKPEPIPGLPDPSIASPNSSAAFPKVCCTDVCLVSIPEAVNIIPEHI